MTSRKTLGLARQWAADIDADRQTLSQDTIDAAVDLIKSMPDAWVDADEVREVITKWDGREISPDAYLLYRKVEALLPSFPRPEDVPVGEPWEVEVYGKAAIGYRNHPESYHCWALVRQDKPWFYYPSDDDVTLIARLVPETTEQDDVPDTDYIYTDREGDRWEYLDGRWITGDTHARRVAERKIRPGAANLPAEFSPYTRIEENEK